MCESLGNLSKIFCKGEKARIADLEIVTGNLTEENAGLITENNGLLDIINDSECEATAEVMRLKAKILELEADSQLVALLRGTVPLTGVETGIDGDELRAAVSAAIPGVSIYPLDSFYRIADIASCRAVMEEYQEIRKQLGLSYVTDYRDCENFSIEFKGRTDSRYMIGQFGIALSNSHGYQIVVYRDADTRELTVKTAEPQGGRFFPVEDGVRSRPSEAMPELVTLTSTIGRYPGKYPAKIRLDTAISNGMYNTKFVMI